MIEQLLHADRLLTVDQVEQARALYERIVALDPGNAIAVVGLARCAAAEGDDRGAHELAAQALRIDPENDAARRMEARLAEVLAARGQLIEPPVGRDTNRSPLRPIVSATPGSLSTADRVPAAPAPPVTPATGRSFLDRLRGR